LGGTSPNYNPTILRSRLFKNPKIVEIIDKGGKELNPIPLREAVDAATERGRADNDDMQGCFNAGQGAQGDASWRLEEEE